MTLIEMFRAGRVPGEHAVPQHILTAISNIFVFENNVYKIYRSDSEFFNKSFNDLSKKENRFSFTRKDFEWNNRLSPEIYADLRGAVVQDDRIELTDPTDGSEELVILMNKIDMSDQVIRLLVDGKITLSDCYAIGRQFGERVSKLPRPDLSFTAYSDFQTRYTDAAAWITSVQQIPQAEVAKYLLFVKDWIENHKEDLDKEGQMSLCLDVHADNAVYTQEKFLPIDTYAPKEAWLYGYENINIYRVATDFYVFLGKEAFDEVIRGYEEATSKTLSRDWDKFLIIYCELIMWPYQYMLSEKESWRLDVAEKHHAFIRSIFTE